MNRGRKEEKNLASLGLTSGALLISIFLIIFSVLTNCIDQLTVLT